MYYILREAGSPRTYLTTTYRIQRTGCALLFSEEAEATKAAESLGRTLMVTAVTNLCAMRMRSGMTQKQLAETVGTTLRTIQYYEQNQKELNCAKALTVLRIARVLGCTMEDLVTDE